MGRGTDLIAQSTTPDGEALTLGVEGRDLVVRVRGETLMSSAAHGSEQAMAALAFAEPDGPRVRRVLVGGLGMGFTLRAVLDRIEARTAVVVVELLPDVVEWNRGPLAHLADRPLDDARVSVEVGDLVAYLDRARGRFDAILVDVDNGPEAFTVEGNARLYGAQGLRRLHAALRVGGVLVVWSAFRSPAFEGRMNAAGFRARTVAVRARAHVRKGARHVLFVGQRGERPPARATVRSIHSAPRRRRR